MRTKGTLSIQGLLGNLGVRRRTATKDVNWQKRRDAGMQLVFAGFNPAQATAQSPAVPVIGLGTCCLKGPDSLQQVSDGLQVGYRVIDTASHYENEAEVAEAVGRAGLQRSDVFIITKVWFDDMGERAPEAIQESLKRLNTDYVDLLLMHFPGANDALQSPSANRKRREMTWRAMEAAKAQGQAKSLGVANFTRRHLKEMFEYCRDRPSVLQTEIHPYFQQTKLVEFCRQNSLQLQSFSPLAHGELNLLEDTGLRLGILYIFGQWDSLCLYRMILFLPRAFWAKKTLNPQTLNPKPTTLNPKP